MKRLVISVLLAVVLLVIPVSGALAAEDTATVTVTAVPSYVAIANKTATPDAWTINNVGGGSGVLEINTTYYSNPQGDETSPTATVAANECYFDLDNTSTVVINIKVDWADFTLGDAMTNVNQTSGDSNTAPDADSFVAWSYYEGMTTYASSKVLAKAADSSNLYSSLAANTDLKWGLEIKTQTGAWSSGTSMLATVTVTATSV